MKPAHENGLRILASFLVEVKNMPIDVLEKYIAKRLEADKYRKAS